MFQEDRFSKPKWLAVSDRKQKWSEYQASISSSKGDFVIVLVLVLDAGSLFGCCLRLVPAPSSLCLLDPAALLCFSYCWLLLMFLLLNQVGRIRPDGRVFKGYLCIVRPPLFPHNKYWSHPGIISCPKLGGHCTGQQQNCMCAHASTHADTLIHAALVEEAT